MAATTTEPRNWTYLAGRTIAGGFLAGALAASYTHIVHLANMGDLFGWQAFVAPVFIDGFAMLGRLARSKNFDEKTRRAGLRVQIAATSLSFIANVVAGDSIGARVFGAMVVIGYVVAEMLSERMSPAATRAQQAAAAKSAAAVKAAATRAANKAKAEAEAARKAERAAQRRAARAEKAEWDRMVAETAPVSPAPYVYDRAYL